ncbi:MAG: lysophospholipid acyltransferase family protein [Actinomycetota bacterium]
MAAGELNPWWRFGLPVVTLLVHLFFRVRIAGLEHVPARGGAIVAFNHVSALDGPALAIELSRRTKRETRFLVAAEFFARTFFGWVLRTFEQIPIHRGTGDANALDTALDALRDGALIAIAPEGAVNPEARGDLQRIRSGVARLALPTGVPIVPVGIWGTQNRWARSGIIWARLWRRPRLAIVFGPPILPDGEAIDADVEDLKERLRIRLVEQVTAARALAGDPEQ